MLRRVAGYGRPYLPLLAGVLVTIVIISAFTVVPPLLIRRLIDDAIPHKDIGLLTWLGAGMITVPIANAIVGGFQRWLSAKAGEGVIFDLRKALFSHLQGMSLRFFTSTRTGELISRLNSDVVGAQQAITGTFVSIVSNIVSVVIILAVMFRAEWRLTLLAVAALPLFVYPARRVAKILRRITEEQMNHNANMSSILQETLNVSGALLVKLFNRAPQEAEKFGVEARHVRDLGVRRALVGRWFFAALGLASAVGTAGVFWVGGYLVIRDQLTIGVIVMFATLLVQLYSPLSALSNTRVEFATSLVSFERVFEVLDLAHEIDEAPDAVQLDSVAGALAFENVRFRYESDDSPTLDPVKRFTPWAPQDGGQDASTDRPASRDWALNEITFRVEPGEMVALVGPSGAGKTTISYLIPRLYDPTSGQVTLDGHPLPELTLDTIADSIGVVTQESYLFHDTIAANLRYASPAATDDELEAACRAANIHDMIDGLPQRYATVVGERGYRLSGGEKQRLALARVILKDPKVLILDEATSHLDSQSEALIQDALEHVLAGRTSVVIAHRLSTILAADRIFVIDNGRVVEEGPHNELLAAGGLYSDLFETQFRDPVTTP